jgi:leucyl-tRNA synthetase
MVMLNVNEQILWPKIDEKILLEENIKFIIQFNGKTRKIIISEKGTGEDLLLQKIKEDSKLNKFLDNKNIQKKIFIPNKLINIITN